MSTDVIDSYPNIKNTLLLTCNTYEEFVHMLHERDIPKEEFLFNKSVCELYVEDDIYSLAFLADGYANSGNTTRADILCPIFKELHNNYVEVYGNA